MADLHIQGLHKYYGQNHVVKGIDLVIPSGEFTVLVGQSGCGKSTLLRTIAGLEFADQGSIAIADQRVNDMPPKDRDIAMVFQNYALYPYMTVFDNIAFGLRARKTPATDIPGKVQRAAEMLAIGHLLDRYPRQLSGGQLQRVAIAGVLAAQPGLVILDEPTRVIDVGAKYEIYTIIAQLAAQGKSILMISSELPEVLGMADRIIVMREGRQVAEFSRSEATQEKVIAAATTGKMAEVK